MIEPAVAHGRPPAIQAVQRSMPAISRRCCTASVCGHRSASSCSMPRELSSSSPVRSSASRAARYSGRSGARSGNLLGALLGATLAFLIARGLGADWLAQWLGGRLRRLVDGVEAEGWRFVALMRLVPLVPFNLLNYALGLTRISLRANILASAVCMLPRCRRLHLAWLCRPVGSRRKQHGSELRPAQSWSACHDRFPSPVVPPVSCKRTGVDRRCRTATPPRCRRSHHSRGCQTARGIHGPVRPSTRCGQCAARRAATVLIAAGLRDVAVLRGGMDGWHRQGLALE